MDKNYLIELLNSNEGLLQDLTQSKFLQDNFIGLLRNIESIIPDDCRDNFYRNLQVMRISFDTERSFSLVSAPLIGIDKRFVSFVDNHIYSNTGLDYEEELLMMTYHELLHISSNTFQVIDDKVVGASGFQDIPKIKDNKYVYEKEDEFNGLTEGFTQYLTLVAFGRNFDKDLSNYGEQLSSVRKLVEKVGLETMKKAYFNNRNGMEPIKDKLVEIGEDPNLYLELEEQCHVAEQRFTRNDTIEATQDVKTSDIRKETAELVQSALQTQEQVQVPSTEQQVEYEL